eukprot:jgi/Tetstr1/460883/TSEL_006040.t1
MRKFFRGLARPRRGGKEATAPRARAAIGSSAGGQNAPGRSAAGDTLTCYNPFDPDRQGHHLRLHFPDFDEALRLRESPDEAESVQSLTNNFDLTVLPLADGDPSSEFEQRVQQDIHRFFAGRTSSTGIKCQTPPTEASASSQHSPSQSSSQLIGEVPEGGAGRVPPPQTRNNPHPDLFDDITWESSWDAGGFGGPGGPPAHPPAPGNDAKDTGRGHVRTSRTTADVAVQTDNAYAHANPGAAAPPESATQRHPQHHWDTPRSSASSWDRKPVPFPHSEMADAHRSGSLPRRSELETARTSYMQSYMQWKLSAATGPRGHATPGGTRPTPLTSWIPSKSFPPSHSTGTWKHRTPMVTRRAGRASAADFSMPKWNHASTAGWLSRAAPTYRDLDVPVHIRFGAAAEVSPGGDDHLTPALAYGQYPAR